MLAEVALYYDRLLARLDQIKDYLEEIGADEEQLNWRPNPNTPSIFALAAFVSMNTDYWIGHAIGNLPEPPGFDNVLEQAHSDDPAPLLRLLDSTRKNISRVLEQITAESFDETFNFNDEPVTPHQCILQALEDAAERCGEIRTMMHWWGSE